MTQTSGQYLFKPSAADLFIEAFARCEMYAPSLERLHMIECRRSANIILQRWANRGSNLWLIGDEQICVALTPGQSTYPLPVNLVGLLDCYLRTYTPNSATINVGNALTALGPPNNPLVQLPYGDPLLQQTSSGVFSCTAGQPEITMIWPAHGQQPGNPLFWGCPISVGGLTLGPFSIVDQVIDWQTLTFLAPSLPLESQQGQGLTPLFFTTAGNPLVGCILPGHGLSPGEIFEIPIPVEVGGFTLSGSYSVYSVQSSYQFSFTAVNATTGPTILETESGNVIIAGGVVIVANLGNAPLATSTGMAFENAGFINVAGQMPNVNYTDIYLYPMDRTTYDQLPNKKAPGRPAQYWFNRTNPPQLVMWPVPPTTPTPPPYYGFVGHRMRTAQDVNPVNGQVVDIPNRFLDAFSAEVAAAMALKFKPAKFTLLKQLAVEAWEEAAQEDREKNSLNLMPDFQAYTL